MGIQIKLDDAAIAKLEEAARTAAVMAMDAVKSDVIAAQVMPFDTGTMQNTDTFTVAEEADEGITARLVTGSPQARRLYYHPEYNFQTANNPNAGGEWLQPWIDGEKADFAENAFIEFYRQKAGV